jgi:hypothetical protein
MSPYHPFAGAGRRGRSARHELDSARSGYRHAGSPSVGDRLFRVLGTAGRNRALPLAFVAACAIRHSTVHGCGGAPAPLAPRPTCGWHGAFERPPALALLLLLVSPPRSRPTMGSHDPVLLPRPEATRRARTSAPVRHRVVRHPGAPDTAELDRATASSRRISRCAVRSRPPVVTAARRGAAMGSPARRLRRFARAVAARWDRGPLVMANLGSCSRGNPAGGRETAASLRASRPIRRSMRGARLDRRSSTTPLEIDPAGPSAPLLRHPRLKKATRCKFRRRCDGFALPTRRAAAPDLNPTTCRRLAPRWKRGTSPARRRLKANEEPLGTSSKYGYDQPARRGRISAYPDVCCNALYRPGAPG